MTLEMTKKMSLTEKLSQIQVHMKAPKNLYNNFGKYSYRNAEGILEAFKPFADKFKVALTVRDEMIQLGDRYYIKAIAVLRDCETDEVIENSAFAREEESKKGMDASQITGAASSYARKYALNGLFCLDDTKDADYLNGVGEEKKDDRKKDEELKKKSGSSIIDSNKVKVLIGLCGELGYKESDVAGFYKKKSFKDFTVDEFIDATKRFEQDKKGKR